MTEPETSTTVEPIWRPSPARVEATAMDAFRRRAETVTGRSMAGFDDLHAWSIADPAAFWSLLADELQLPFETRGTEVLSSESMPSTRWFDGSTLNYARALLYPPGLADDEATAIVGLTEVGGEDRLSWRELRTLVAQIQSALETQGVKRGDAVAAIAANVPETLALLLACAGLGVLFSSCSPDFGAGAAAARFEQLAPKLLFASNRYRYGGKRFDVTDSVRELAAALPSLRAVVLLPYPGEPAEIGPRSTDGALPGVPFHTWHDWLGAAPTATEPRTVALPFDEPLYVLYSSGTTGPPKAMVHRAGGALLQHAKEQRLHSDIRPGDVVFYFTTCGWMMWNWLVSALAQAATVVLYDGSPAYPDNLALFEQAERLGVTFFGTSARFIHELQATNAEPGARYDLSRLKTVASTGSPLSPSGFEYVYRAIKPDLHLASISGGTDIVSCFMLGVPTLPVYPGQIQRAGLGVDLRVLDGDGGELVGEPGELVCAKALPSMPLAFLDDPKGERYWDAYFTVYPGLWRHGDLVERTEQGGFVMYGRSDATLNPGGVRIGTAEIYRPLEAISAVAEAAAVAKRTGSDQEVWLLVVLRGGAVLDEELTARIRGAIRHGATPRHVPARVIDVPELPRTRSGKAMEMAVSRLVNGLSVPNVEVMANPESVRLIEERLHNLKLA